MPMTIEEKANQIVEDIRQEKGINPVHIFKNMAKKDYISIHGPEHHILDGACIRSPARAFGCPVPCAASGESAAPSHPSGPPSRSLTEQVLYRTTDPGVSI